jgi:hypothetical protein
MIDNENDPDSVDQNDINNEFGNDDDAARAEAERMFLENQNDQMDDLFFGDNPDENS